MQDESGGAPPGVSVPQAGPDAADLSIRQMFGSPTESPERPGPGRHEGAVSLRPHESGVPLAGQDEVQCPARTLEEPSQHLPPSGHGAVHSTLPPHPMPPPPQLMGMGAPPPLMQQFAQPPMMPMAGQRPVVPQVAPLIGHGVVPGHVAPQPMMMVIQPGALMPPPVQQVVVQPGAGMMYPSAPYGLAPIVMPPLPPIGLAGHGAPHGIVGQGVLAGQQSGASMMPPAPWVQPGALTSVDMAGAAGSSSAHHALGAAAPARRRRGRPVGSGTRKRRNEPRPPRPPSAYNLFMRDEIQRLKQLHPEMAHREVFTMAAKNWVCKMRLVRIYCSASRRSASRHSLAHAPSLRASPRVSQECADSNPAGCIIVKDPGTRGGERGSGAAASGGDDDLGDEGGGNDSSTNQGPGSQL